MLKKIGDTVVITNNTCYHNFKIGESVVITETRYVKEHDYHYYTGVADIDGQQWCFKNEDFA